MSQLHRITNSIPLMPSCAENAAVFASKQYKKHLIKSINSGGEGGGGRRYIGLPLRIQGVSRSQITDEPFQDFDR